MSLISKIKELLGIGAKPANEEAKPAKSGQVGASEQEVEKVASVGEGPATQALDRKML